MTEKKEQEKQKEDPSRCNKCGSGFIYYRIKTKEKVCRSCGNIEKPKEKKS